MFFGLVVKSSQSKPIILENTTKFSQAVLEPSKTGNGDREPVSLVVEYNKKQHVLCVLDPRLSYNVPLDLVFECGAELKFILRGSGTVHLTGYEPLDDYDDMDLSISSVSSDDEHMEVTPNKNKKELTNGTGSTSKISKKSDARSPKVPRRASLKPVTVTEEDVDEEESDDEDFEYEGSSDSEGDFELVKQGLEASSTEDDDGSDEEIDSDEEIEDEDDNDDDDDDDDDDDGCQIEEMSDDSD